MAIEVHNPYTGKDDETCSVSFAAQQQMGAHDTGSSQTEAEYNKSKLLGEWGVLKGKVAKGEIPNGTKVLTYTKPNGRGYLYVQNGKLRKKVYTDKSKPVDEEAKADLGDLIIKSPLYDAAIPQAVSKKPKPEPKYADAGYINKINNLEEDELPQNKEPLAVKPDGSYVAWDPYQKAFVEIGEDDRGNFDEVDANFTFKGLVKPEQHWQQPDKDATNPKKPKVEPAAAPKPTTLASPTPLSAVNAGSDSLGSMSHEDVAAMFVKIKDDLAKEKGLAIKGANADLDNLVYEKIGLATGYTPGEVKAKIDAYKADGNKLSALKKKVLAGTKKVPTGVVFAKDPSPIGKIPDPISVAPLPKLNVGQAVSKKDALDKLAALGEGNGYVNGGTAALGLKQNTVGLNKIGDEGAKKFGEPLGTDLKDLATKHGVQEMVDTSTTELYTNQTWLFSKVVKKYVNNPSDSAVLAVRKDGKIIVVDGNHRAAAAKLTNSKVKMVILDLDSTTPTTGGKDTKPNGVPTAATPKLANEIKAEVKAEVSSAPAKHYTPEDVASAYIIAKDAIVASNTKGWTLYTKNDEFDLEIAIQVGLKTGLSPSQQKGAIADYLASGKKLSALKKQLAKQGAFNPQADTKKKSSGTKSDADNAKDVNAKADAGYTPTQEKATGSPKKDTGTEPPKAVKDKDAELGDISAISPADQTAIFNAFKSHGSLTYLSSGPANNYDAFIKVQAELEVSGQKYSLLQLIRVVDAQGAKKANVDNGKTFEKQVATWLTTPAGTKHVKDAEANKAKLLQQTKNKAEAEKVVKELRANQPALPADSAQFEGWSLSKARARSNAWLEREPLRGRQKAGLQHYTGDAYVAMNSYLRGLEPYKSTIGPTDKGYIQPVIDGMRPTDEPILVKRGTGANQFVTLGVERGETSLLWGITGKSFKDDGFLSTSASGYTAFEGECLLEIECPVGTPMMCMDPFSKHQGENEMLLQAGITYKILQVRQDKPGQYIIRCRVTDWPGKK